MNKRKLVLEKFSGDPFPILSDIAPWEE